MNFSNSKVKRLYEYLISEIEKDDNIVWYYKDAIDYMINNHSLIGAQNNYKQMEWHGFYFELYSQIKSDSFSTEFKLNFPKYGRVSFDGFLDYPIDFKSHISNKNKNIIPGNGRIEVSKAIKDYGKLYLFVAVSIAEFEDEYKREVREYVNSFDGESKYSKRNRENNVKSRPRKKQVHLKELLLLEINQENIERVSGTFQKDMINSNGKPRNTKYTWKINKFNQSEIVRYKFK